MVKAESEGVFADVVVLGAGFGGKAVVDSLVGRLARNGARSVRVIVIDRRNYQLFTPMLYQAATGLVDPAHITVPIREDARKRGFEFVKAQVRSINLAHKLVVTDVGNFAYNQLVVALGSVPDDGRIPGAKGRCIPLKTLDDGEAIHNRILSSFEAAVILPKDDPRRRRFLTFVVIGGSTGAELAGSVRDYVDLLCKYYPSIERSDCKVVIVERRDRLFPGGEEKLSGIVRRALEHKGVEVRLNVKVTRINPAKVELEDGSSIAAENIFWDAGTRPNPVLEDLSASMIPKHKDKILVDQFLRIPVFDAVYVVGDDAAVENLRQKGEHSPRFVPPNAEAAIEEGKYVGRRIASIICHQKEDQRPFAFKEKGEMLSLGHRYGVVRFRHLTLKGFLGWVTWRAVHVALLSSRSGRFNVIVDWTLGSFKERNISELGEVPSARPSDSYDLGQATDEGERRDEHETIAREQAS